MSNTILNPNVAPTAQVSTDASSLAFKVTGVLGFTLATALAAKINIPLADTPVPITLQSFAVLLAGVTLGPWLGAASMVLYTLLGLAGYAVFASEQYGFTYLLGPTGGYLLGFIAAQFVIGFVTRLPRTSIWHTLAVLLAGHAVVFLCGLPWLALWGGYDLAGTLDKGLNPFILGTLVKSAAAWPIARMALARVRASYDPV